MTVGPESSDVCVSHITTPVRVYAPITPTPAFSSLTPTALYLITSIAETPRSTISSIITLNEGLAIADPVIVGWQDEDLQSFPDDYATSLAHKIGVAPPSKTATPNSSSATSRSSQGLDDLSTGAKAGIGVGVIVGAAAIGIVFVFFFMQRRQKHGRARLELMPEMEGEGHKDRDLKWFFGGKWRNEVHAEAAPNELESKKVDVAPNELDSRAVHVVPGSPVELDGSMLQREMVA